jgi:hypothetical protein
VILEFDHWSKWSKTNIVEGATLHDGREEERVQGESGGERVKEGGRDKECPGCPAAAGRKGQLKKSCYPLVTVHRRVLQFLHSFLLINCW